MLFRSVAGTHDLCNADGIVMKADEIRAKNDTELAELLLEIRRKQFSLRMQQGTGQPVRSSEIREARKDVARIKTIIEERRQGDAA